MCHCQQLLLMWLPHSRGKHVFSLLSLLLDARCYLSSCSFHLSWNYSRGLSSALSSLSLSLTLKHTHTESMEINARFGAPEPLMCMTWVLRVSIHCEGCKKKVKKVLQSIEGVYKVDIDPEQHKVVITGNVDAETLIKKLVKSGKQAEIWPCNFSDNEENKSRKSKKKKKKKKKKHQEGGPIATKDDESDPGDDENITFDEDGENPTKHEGNIGTERMVEVDTESGGGGGNVGKKKKKKGKKGNIGAGVANYDGSPANTGSVPAPGSLTPVVDQVNLNLPSQHMFYHPQFHYGVPEHGMSYNAAPSTSASSYYAVPRQYNTYAHPYFAGPSPPSYREVDYYYHEDESGCSIM